MAEYRLFIQNNYDRVCGYYHTYGISVFDGGELIRIVRDVSTDRGKVEQLVEAFNENDLDTAHLNQAIEEFLYDYKV